MEKNDGNRLPIQMIIRGDKTQMEMVDMSVLSSFTFSARLQMAVLFNIELWDR